LSVGYLHYINCVHAQHAKDRRGVLGKRERTRTAPICNDIETMEHILTKCEETPVETIWKMANQTLLAKQQIRVAHNKHRPDPRMRKHQRAENSRPTQQGPTKPTTEEGQRSVPTPPNPDIRISTPNMGPMMRASHTRETPLHKRDKNEMATND